MIITWMTIGAMLLAVVYVNVIERRKRRGLSEQERKQLDDKNDAAMQLW